MELSVTLPEGAGVSGMQRTALQAPVPISNPGAKVSVVYFLKKLPGVGSRCAGAMGYESPVPP